MKAESLVKPSKESAVATGKKPYTRPTLKVFGAVTELTNGNGKSHIDGYITKKGH
jgi:hypothetical protein